MKRKMLPLLCAIMALVLTGCRAPWDFFKYAYNNIDDYELYVDEARAAKGFMPTLDDIDFEEAEVFYFYKSIGGYRTLNLVLTFTPDNFETHKQMLLETKNFLTEPIKYNDRYYFSPLEYQGFLIKAIGSPSPTGLSFCMIGFNETDFKVNYMSYFEGTGSGESSDMEKLISKHFLFEMPYWTK